MKRWAFSVGIAAMLLGGCMAESATSAPAAPPASPGSIPIAAAPSKPVAVAPVAMPQQPPNDPAAAEPSAVEAAECKAKGGSMQRAGLAGQWRCVIAYKDAGKACTDGDQCEGDCWASTGKPEGGAVTGQCQPTNMPFGCHAVVEDGKAGPALCVD